jgi:hypothetical protein
LAGEQDSQFEPIIDPEVERRWRLAWRTDLADAFGIVLSVPEHGQDEYGNWRYGLRPEAGLANPEFEAEFEAEMRELIRRSASSLASNGLLTQQEAEAIEPHSYSVGPAAQEWSKLFFELYQDARPHLADGASILAWGYFLRDVVKAIWSWAARKEREQYGSAAAEASVYSGNSAMPRLVLTRPAIVALCYTDFVERHAVSGDIILETFPRSFTTYATMDHPGGQESYLVRARIGRRSFFYHVFGTGEVNEHYLLAGSTVTLLPLPNFLESDAAPLLREPLSSQRIEIKEGRSKTQLPATRVKPK